MLVDQAVLTQWARSPVYNGLQTLDPLRRFLKANPPRGCCGKPAILPDIPQTVFDGIGGDPRFVAELADLRIRIGAPRFTVAVGSARFTVPPRP